MRNKMRERRAGLWALAAAAVMSGLLAGCGGEQAPEVYLVGEEELPSLTQLVGAAADADWTRETDPDTGEERYCYSGLERPGEAVSAYAEALENEHGCAVVDPDGVMQEAPDYSAESGTVWLGRDGSAGDGLLLLEISWTGDGCTCTPHWQEGGMVTEARAEALTLEEALDVLAGCTPDTLGLAGQSMEEYALYPDEGLVMVDAYPCMEFNIYEKATHAFQGTYLVSEDGAHIYRLDRESREVRELKPGI